MKSEQIDQLCRDWLVGNYGDEIALEYMVYSLVIPSFDSKELNYALEELRLTLCIAFGPEQSFGSTDYQDARDQLGLIDNRTPVPDVFVRAFTSSLNRG